MWQSFLKVVATSSIRVATITLFCLGFTFASTFPYQSIIGVDQLGLSTGQFSMLMLAVAIAGMIGSFVLGYASDLVVDRKRSILIVLAIGAFGFGAFALLPSIWSFMLCLLVFAPISNSAYGQLFAVIRTQTNILGSKEAASVNSVVRSIYAGSWIIVPGLVGLFIATRKNVSDSFAIAAAAFMLSFLIYLFFGAETKNIATSQLSAWAGFKAALKLVGSKTILLRLLALSLIATPHPVNAALLPLMITHFSGGNTMDVGIMVGLVAGLEIPFMLLGGYFGQSKPIWFIIVCAGLVHASYLFGLGFAHSLWQIYALAVLNAAGAAILLSQHMNYYQDLMPDRPGLGTSLQSISSLLYKGYGAAVFASAGTIIGFSGAAWLGGALALLGCVMLFALDRAKA
jgi:MFS family permease